jgi:hypothetical protein
MSTHGDHSGGKPRAGNPGCASNRFQFGRFVWLISVQVSINEEHKMPGSRGGSLRRR